MTENHAHLVLYCLVHSVCARKPEEVSMI